MRFHISSAYHTTTCFELACAVSPAKYDLMASYLGTKYTMCDIEVSDPARAILKDQSGTFRPLDSRNPSPF